MSNLLEEHAFMPKAAQYVNHFKMNEYLDLLKTTAAILCQLSGHQYVCYGYQLHQQFLCQHNLGNAVYLEHEFEFNLKGLEPTRHIYLAESEFGQCFLEFLAETDIIPKGASVLKIQLPNLQPPIYFILFSQQDYHVEMYTWQVLQDYLQQQLDYFNLKAEAQSNRSRLNKMEEINMGRSKYFSVIAHDLRAPFHGILGCADILANESDTLDKAAERRLLDYLYDTTQATYGLLENLLNWTMAEGGRFHEKKMHFRVNDVVQTVFDLLCAFAYKKQIKLQCDIAPSLYAYADVRMVTSILQNLTSNALKFTPAMSQKSIKISAMMDGGDVKIIISDEGVGMSTLQIEKLFQEDTIPSTQGTAGEKGTGLGMVLCKRFLEMNGGSIAIESVLNQGSQFIVRLPLGSDAI